MDIKSLQEKLRFNFRQPSLLEQALVHSSFVNENPAIAPVSNERLEFLGDAVLDMVIAEELFRRFPDCPEGELTVLRSALVCGGALADIARDIGLGEHLSLGKGEEASGGRRKAANLASALEAVLAAVYLDGGFDAARKTILGLFGAGLGSIGREQVIDYKSRLQALVQARYKQAPAYRTEETLAAGDEHVFTSEARLGDTVLGRGRGKNKKSAETDAARSAMAAIEDDFTGHSASGKLFSPHEDKGGEIMGSRDIRHHETKKPKKGAKKAAISEILPPPVQVEVIKKKRKEPEEEA